MKRLKAPRLPLLLLGITLLFIGCGPIQSTQRISEAEVAVERARVNEADRFAPYEYYSARNYLYMAKKQWAYSNFQAALDYATDARRAAEASIRKAQEDPWPGSPLQGAEDLPPDDGTDRFLRP